MKWMLSPTRLLAYLCAMLLLSEPAFSEPALISPPIWDIAEDTDQDGLRDVDELWMFGMDALDPSDGLSDDDADLLSMAWEIFYETDPDLADTDGDTWTDSEELLIYGTDPLDPLSFPQGIGENDQKTTENPSSSTTFASQPTAALVQTPPPPSLSNGEFNDLVVTNFRHHTGADYQGKVFDWGSGAGDANGWIAYKGSLIEVWKSGDERFIELDGWKDHYGVKQPIANVAPGSHVLYWQQSGRTSSHAGDNAYRVQVYYVKDKTEVIVAETGNIANIDKTKWTPKALGFTITAEQILDANGSPFYVAFIPRGNDTYGTLIDKVGLIPVEITVAFGHGPDPVGEQTSRELLEEFLLDISQARHGDVWVVKGKDQKGNEKLWGLEIVTDQSKLNAALGARGRHVVFDGHSNYGFGPDFLGSDKISQISDFTNYGAGYTDVHLTFRKLIKNPQDPNDPINFGDPYGNLEIPDDQIAVAPTNYKPLPINELRFPNIDNVGEGQVFPKQGHGSHAWHNLNDKHSKRLMITAPNTDLPFENRYKSFFYNACSSGIDYIENFKHGVFIYTKDTCKVEMATTIYVQGVIENKSNDQIMTELNKDGVGNGENQSPLIYEYKSF